MKRHESLQRTTVSKMSLSGECEEGNGFNTSLSGECEAAARGCSDMSSLREQPKRPQSPTPSCLSMKSDGSMPPPLHFSKEACKLGKSEVTDSELPEDLFQIDMSDPLKKLKDIVKVKLRQHFKSIHEGFSLQGKSVLLTEIYTELYITVGGSGQVNNEHEVRQIELMSKRHRTQETPIKCNEIFKALPGQRRQIRTVLTKGIAGIGKTVSVQKFILDWTEGKANQDIMVIVPLPFRDLNLKKENYSLIQLLHHYAPELKEIKYISDENLKLLFIFDGLDECRLPLDFQNNELCRDVTESTSVDVLLTNLIKGNLLPSALIWITSRPAAANQIPPECVHQVTEIRGFNDPQKEEYFRKRIRDPSLASRIVTHIKSSRSLHIMCHIPVFCWLSATVLETMMSDAGPGEIPRTLTEMYTHFLLIQMSLKNKKYHGSTTLENPKRLSQSDREMILKLGKLAFQQLARGNLIFYEEDLRECGIDVSKASEYSSLCTEIFREELGLYRERVFCFVHLSIQEHLAAVYAHVSCVSENKNVFGPLKPQKEKDTISLTALYQTAVTRTLRSKNGHLDLFLRFLLGLLLDSNQSLLQELLTGDNSEMRTYTTEQAISCIKWNISLESSPERIINLFHCLNELNDNSLVEEIQTAFRSGTLSDKQLEPDQCSALAFVLLMSQEVLEEFDLKMFKTSAAGQQRLLPVLKMCRIAKLDHCDLSSESCVTVALALPSVNSPLRELDLSSNNLTVSGVKLLTEGLMSPNCKIWKLGLAGCDLSSKSCEHVASILQSMNSALVELDLRSNNLTDLGLKLLSVGLMNPNCKLQKLGLDNCNLSSQSCMTVVLALQSVNSSLRELDLSDNNLSDSGVKVLTAGLMSPNCKLQKLELRMCSITEACCVNVASVLQCPHSDLRALELRDNDLKDSGVKSLSAGLEDPGCKLEKLGLSGCLITEEGCASLASSLRSNPSHLRELDLSYNHPGDSGVKLFSDLLEDQHYKLGKLELDHCDECRVKLGFRKYARQLTLDQNTAHANLSLSEGNRRVTHVLEKRRYLDHPERFKFHPQVLCKEALAERCYWEVEWEGEADIGVRHRHGNRERTGWDADLMGMDDKSFGLVCQRESFHFWHRGKRAFQVSPPPSPTRVGVYLDWAGGTLSFYSVFSDTLTLLYTFQTTFTEPLYAGFRVNPDSSVTLCQLEYTRRVSIA
ncbi:NLR family CARD domain-containing protein 3 isoform X2 [Chanos chanos]|uniref:NLR family CARD domain-containing protein 3 isoform X2 n=1 Tax=Chanos chanos TaxID=29144 RepID=A0A6J2W2L8_CHACN|nr:NLR family CARD domain-containing protein 3-like isoform X2 [Chanos chanos]